MSSSEHLGYPSPAGRVLLPYLNRIIKNASWRKHSALISSCKSALDLLHPTLPSLPPSTLLPLILALETSFPKLASPALDASHRLFSLSLLRAEIPDPSSSASDDSVSRLIASICACGGLGDDSLELGILRSLLAAVRSPALFLRGECLLQIVKSCYNVCLGSQSAASQACAKAGLVQILMIVFARVEAGRLEVEIQPAAVAAAIADVLDLEDKNLVQAARSFVEEAMGGDGVKVAEEEEPGEGGVGEDDDGGVSKIREDGFFLFKNLCKFSMKFAAPGEDMEDPLLLRGKVLSLELLKVVMENAGTFWLVNER